MKKNNKKKNNNYLKSFYSKKTYQRIENKINLLGVNYKYNAVTKNDIIVMNIYSVVNDCAIPRSGDGSWFESYYFDIKNDKELTVGEAAKALEIKNLDNAKSYEELDGAESCAVIKINNGNLEVEAPLPQDCI